MTINHANGLYAKFARGLKYFSRLFEKNQVTNIVIRQLEVFNREVVDPMDRVCVKLSKEERNDLEWTVT